MLRDEIGKEIHRVNSAQLSYKCIYKLFMGFKFPRYHARARIPSAVSSWQNVRHSMKMLHVDRTIIFRDTCEICSLRRLNVASPHMSFSPRRRAKVCARIRQSALACEDSLESFRIIHATFSSHQMSTG